MVHPSRPPPQAEGRLPLWLSPWLWAGAGAALGALVVAGYLVGAASGLWPWLPDSGPLHRPQQTRVEPKPLPQAGPAQPGECRPLALPVSRGGETVVAQGRICLQDNGQWALFPFHDGSAEAKP